MCRDPGAVLVIVAAAIEERPQLYATKTAEAAGSMCSAAAAVEHTRRRTLLTAHDPAPWREVEASRLGDLYNEGTLCSFQDMQDIYILGAGIFLAYNALVVATRNTWEAGQNEPRLRLGLQCFLLHRMGRKAITVLALCCTPGVQTTHFAVSTDGRTVWEQH
ncbi:hypothetical protein NDU88_005449 [Pleurodeles waltl]|uniref:Uncharacterized protein n=1 Tax=Pleurodeles waltl TaxID=8319 RepID=A0AAV7PFK2_PLEWA|nr:hypothetical protein NDU88_005449 [Pleurodeles waltl]